MAVPVPNDRELHRIAVTGIIWKEENGVRRYLVTKRAAHKQAWPEKWTVPGGGLEIDDYLHLEPSYEADGNPQWYGVIERALRREIREEVGLEVEDIRYLLDVAAMHGGRAPLLVLSLYCRYASGEVRLDEDATEFAWITAEEAGKYEFIAGIANEIGEVERRLSKK